MAFYSGSQTNAAGSLITILDALVPNNAYWSVYDNPGTNESVYECSYPGAECYLHMADNQTNYATVKMWEGWDAVNNVGVGISTGTTVYWRKTTGTYWVVLHDYHFIYAHFGTNLNYAYYFGNIDRFCPHYNTPILTAVRSSSTTGINPMGMLANLSTSCYFVCLDMQTKRSLGCYAEYAQDADSVQGYMGMTYRESVGTVKVFLEEPIIQTSQMESLGIMRGIVPLGTALSGVAAADTCTDGDSDVWELIYAGFGSWIRKA